jgi:hypothetical protein
LIPCTLYIFAALKGTVKRRIFLPFLLEKPVRGGRFGAFWIGKAAFSAAGCEGAARGRTCRFSAPLFDCAPGEGNFLQYAGHCWGGLIKQGNLAARWLTKQLQRRSHPVE